MLCSITFRQSPTAFGFSHDQYIVQHAAEVQNGFSLRCSIKFCNDDWSVTKILFLICLRRDNVHHNVHVLSLYVIVVTCYCRTATASLVSVKQLFSLLCLSLIQPSEVMTLSSLNCSVKLQLKFSIQQQICYLWLLTTGLDRQPCFKMCLQYQPCL